MPKMMPQISDAEIEVMKILWKLGRATSAEIVNALSEVSEWKPKTIQTLITRLVGKKVVKAKKLDGKSYLYTPVIKEDEYKCYASQSFLKRLYNGSLNLMLTNYVKEQRLPKEEIEALRKLLDEEEGKD